MPIKRRRPKGRMVTVTPRALELFRELQRQKYPTDAWFDVHLLLHREMQARPWEYPLHRNVYAMPIWEALEKAAEAADAREREKTALAVPEKAPTGALKETVVPAVDNLN
jgi:hypothetical protein